MIRALALTAFAAGAFGAALVAAPVPVSGARQTETPVDFRSQLERARQDAARARERVADFDRQARKANLASERTSLAAARLAAQVQEQEAAVAAAQAELALLTGRRKALDARLAREREPVTRLVAGLEEMVRRPPLLTLVQPGSVEDAVHLRAVVSAVAPQVRARTLSLREDIAATQQLERDTARAAASSRASQLRLDKQRQDLDTLAAAQMLEARRATGAADREAERAFLAAEKARDLEGLLARFGARDPIDAPDVTSAVATGVGPEGYRLPVSGRLAAAPKPAGVLTLVPQPGAQIVAPSAGRIAFAGPYRGYGKIVIIEHPGNWTSLVTGLGALQVAVGQKVVAGSPLGRAGTSDPQIGIELRHLGKRVDPMRVAR